MGLDKEACSLLEDSETRYRKLALMRSSATEPGQSFRVPER